jgi:hypothetical protein
MKDIKEKELPSTSLNKEYLALKFFTFIFSDERKIFSTQIHFRFTTMNFRYSQRYVK